MNTETMPGAALQRAIAICDVLTVVGARVPEEWGYSPGHLDRESVSSRWPEAEILTELENGRVTAEELVKRAAKLLCRPDRDNTDCFEAFAKQGYPQTWDEYVGQEPAKRLLKLAASSARRRNKAMAHTLIASGTPGIGKTALGLLVARELGAGVKVLAGAVSVEDARMALSEMNNGDVLFIDEIHQVFGSGRIRGEWLLHLLQDGMILGPLGPEPTPDVTVIGATTDVGKLPETVVGRFTLRPWLDPYDEDDATELTRRMGEAAVVGGVEQVRPDTWGRLAEAGNRNPRQIKRLVSLLRDVLVTGEAGDDPVDTVLMFAGVTSDGLDRDAVTYLTVLVDHFRGRAGREALGDKLGETGNLGATEKILSDKGYLVRTSKGRTATADGLRRAKALLKEEK